MIFVDNREGLIGDFLGTIPAIQRLSEEEIVLIKIHPEASGLFELIKNDRISRIISYSNQMNPITLSSSEAFQIAAKKNYYMSQAFMEQARLEVPDIAPKAKLNYEDLNEPKGYYDIDYLISPFARSLPEDQKWPIERWLELVRCRYLSHLTFGVLGNSKYDERNIWKNEKNVVPLYDYDFKTLCRIYRDCEALISVVTGTSHLAFHLGVRNILLTNQNMTWGNNPDAIKITDYIPNITVEQVIELL